jgi:hypothetical protein
MLNLIARLCGFAVLVMIALYGYAYLTGAAAVVWMPWG